MPLKKNALGPSEAACIEQYKVVTKEDGGWLVTLFVTTPKVNIFLHLFFNSLVIIDERPYMHVCCVNSGTGSYLGGTQEQESQTSTALPRAAVNAVIAWWMMAVAVPFGCNSIRFIPMHSSAFDMLCSFAVVQVNLGCILL